MNALFKIFGIIALSNSDANKKLDETTGKADKVGSAFSRVGTALLKGVGVAVTAAATGIAALGKSSISAYADYEQLVGGVETLFKESQSIVMGYAENAYKTAGLSANEYMETVTSFSASLLQSLDGDTAAAAEKADLAITDMADNANKMGTSMESIQNAYQGFAKQNYTMLDNLKLGYGGTKEEMERLLQDAEKLSGVEYDISSYADIVDAIHVVQTEMGITGTTAKEAATTIQGSVSSMKGAWQNFVTGLADENADMDQLMGNLVDSVITVGKNLIPRIQTLLPRIAEGLTTLASSVAQQLPGIMQTVVPSLLTAAADLVVALVQGIVDTLPMLIPVAVEAILTITTGLMEMLPEITQAAIDIIVELASGFAEALPELIPTVVSIILEIAAILTEPSNLTTLIDAAIEIITALADGLLEALPQLIEQAPEIISSLVEAIKENAPEMLSAAVEIITSLAEGIGENFGEIGETAGGAISSVVEGLEDFVTWLSEGSAGAEVLKAVVIAVAAAFVTYKTITTAITIAQQAWSAITKVVSAAQAVLNAVLNANPIMLIITLIVALVAAFIYLWNNCEEFRQFFLDMWEGIKTAFAAVVDWFSVAASNVAQFFVSAWEWIKSAWASVTSFFSDIWQGICDVFSAIGEWFSEKFTEASEAIQNAWDSVVGFFEEIWESVKEVFSGALDVGKQIIEDIKQGISDAWAGLVSFFTGLWDSLFGNRTVSVSATANGTAVNGSHASGLDYVPFDGYIAELHKGEMVVPAAESNFLRSGGIAAATQQQNAAIVGLLGQILDAVRDVDLDGMTLDLNKREFGRLVRAVT